MKQNKWMAVLLLLVLVAVSLFKDEFTPDYRNTWKASFLSPENLTGSRIQTLSTHYLFWIKSFLYSLCFLILPPLIIHFAFAGKKLTQATLWLHIALIIILYSSILLNMNVIDMVVVSKLNRYLHSPIITLFLWAAFTLTIRNDKNG